MGEEEKKTINFNHIVNEREFFFAVLLSRSLISAGNHWSDPF